MRTIRFFGGFCIKGGSRINQVRGVTDKYTLTFCGTSSGAGMSQSTKPSSTHAYSDLRSTRVPGLAMAGVTASGLLGEAGTERRSAEVGGSKRVVSMQPT